MKRNPFEIKTPENNTAEEIVGLFVDVFTDFNKILETNHAFLNGPRGSGKSMMFRYMLPDCQMMLGKKSSELDYFALYIPIKLTSINVVDLERLENHANTILNEHLLVTLIMSRSFKFIADKLGPSVLNEYTSEIKSFVDNAFNYYATLNDIDSSKIVNLDSMSGIEYFNGLALIIDKLHVECRKRCNQIALDSNSSIYPSFNIPLIDYIDFMLPVFSEMAKIPCFPKGKPFFLLVDDAGYLNETQTKVLNTWVSYRTTGDICIKLSTQLDYKTYLTTNGKRIDSPHDYTEINIATIYTSSKNKYLERVSSIVEKRLSYYLKLNVSPYDFFPTDAKQEQEIRTIYEQLYRENYDSDRDYAGGDAARRYAVPEYIKQLKSKRSASTYNYAGFKQLVGVSSGIIRHFLAPASEMYIKQATENGEKNSVEFIKDGIQNSVIREYSKNFIFNEIEKTEKESDVAKDIATKLFNLVDCLGQLFLKILLSNCSERRVFSVALTDNPDNELKYILDKGVQLGFFHESTIGNKEGIGRNKLYVLSRVLSPHYGLDPSSFAGYQFMSSTVLKLALNNRRQFLAQFDNKFKETAIEQPSLFDYENYQ